MSRHCLLSIIRQTMIGPTEKTAPGIDGAVNPPSKEANSKVKYQRVEGVSNPIFVIEDEEC